MFSFDAIWSKYTPEMTWMRRNFMSGGLSGPSGNLCKSCEAEYYPLVLRKIATRWVNIVATLGSASSDPVTLERLISAGLNIATNVMKVHGL